MNNTKSKKREGEKSVPAPSKVRVARYIAFRNLFPMWTKSKCAQLAGYKNSIDACKIEATHQFKALSLNVDKQREMLQKTPGFMLADKAEKLRQIENNEIDLLGLDEGVQVTPGNIISAIKESKELLGYKAEERIDVQHRGLFLHLNQYSGDDIRQAMEAQGVYINEDD